MALFKINKGLKDNLPAAKTEGYCWYTTDDSLFYIDYVDENGVLLRKALNAKDAETLTGASLSTILNSSDIEIPTSKAVLDAIETIVSSKADVSHNHDDAYAELGHTHTYESITGIEDVINNVADSKFYVVTFDMGTDNKYHADLTFAEIREKFEAGGNMVARIDGTDYIPLLSAASHQIIFSGIYNAQSVSLTINSSDECTLTTTSLTANSSLLSHTSNTSNPHKVTCEQIGAATTSDIENTIAILEGKSDSTHNHDSDYDAKGSANTALETAKSYTDTKTENLISASDADIKISTHNTSTSAHDDIRALITDLSTAVNNFLDVDDTTKDQLSEVLTLIENNKGTLESLTTSKVNVSDIIDNLTTNSADKVLSAAQGVVIQGLIDALQVELDSHTHEVADVYGLQTYLDSIDAAYDLATDASTIANAALPKSGGTMTGALVAQNNTDYTTKQVRNIILVAEGEDIPTGANGDVCLVYTP